MSLESLISELQAEGRITAQQATQLLSVYQNELDSSKDAQIAASRVLQWLNQGGVTVPPVELRALRSPPVSALSLSRPTRIFLHIVFGFIGLLVGTLVYLLVYEVGRALFYAVFSELGAPPRYRGPTGQQSLAMMVGAIHGARVGWLVSPDRLATRTLRIVGSLSLTGRACISWVCVWSLITIGVFLIFDRPFGWHLYGSQAVVRFFLVLLVPSIVGVAAAQLIKWTIKGKN